MNEIMTIIRVALEILIGVSRSFAYATSSNEGALPRMTTRPCVILRSETTKNLAYVPVPVRYCKHPKNNELHRPGKTHGVF